MSNLSAVLALVIAAVLAASPAAGQQADVSFAAGRVTITAREAPLAAIFGAWQRHGGSRFVGASRLPGEPVTVQLVDVPEREALRVLLRAAAGYVAIPKAETQSGASAYDRVLIMAGPASAGAQRVTGAGPESAAGADQRPGLGGPPEGALAAADAAAPGESADFLDDEFDDLDELELVESLRRRYQAATTTEGGDDAPAFRRQPDGSPLGTAPRGRA